MAADYDKQILRILHYAGDNGIKLNLLTKNVFNENNSFFENVSYDDMYKYVCSFIQKNLHSQPPIIEATGKRGFYRISKVVDSQLMFDFDEDEEEEDEKELETDESLSLF